MSERNKNLKSLEEFKEEHYGKIGTPKRDELEAGFENFKIGALIHAARIEKGMTQEELAEKAGTTKSYISKIENNIKEARLSTLQKIVNQPNGFRRTAKLKNLPATCRSIYKLLRLDQSPRTALRVLF